MFCFSFFILLLLRTLEAAPAEQWVGRAIYQIITDRFSLASGAQDSCNNGNCQYGNYCGGSFKGIKNNLKYIRDMGFDAIWISPIVKNIDCGYHGYWAFDLNSTNPNFGTESDLKDLVKAAHNMGIWVMVDIVANHMGNADLNSFPQFSGNDFHSSCSINYEDQNSVENCWLAGLPDLKSESDYVQSIFMKWVTSLISEYGFDGIRIDTIPYVPKSFWSEMNSQLPNTFTIGEILIGGIGANDDFIPGYIGTIDSVLHYRLFWSIRNTFMNQQDFVDLSNTFKVIGNKYNSHAIPYLGTFVDNHDNDRFLYKNNNWQLLKNALAFIYTTQGIPIVYYGTEQGQNTGGSDDANRDPLWKHGGMNEGSELFQYVKKLNSIRTAKYCGGSQTEVWHQSSYYIFSREACLVIVSNQGNANVKVSKQYLPAWVQSLTRMLNVMTGSTIDLNNGDLNFNLNGDPMILVKPQDFTPRPTAPPVTSKPATLRISSKPTASPTSFKPSKSQTTQPPSVDSTLSPSITPSAIGGFHHKEEKTVWYPGVMLCFVIAVAFLLLGVFFGWYCRDSRKKITEQQIEGGGNYTAAN